ncbi:MAG: M20/M25/M40 family metallo-hydrolase [Alphaproteobacteria bacterium]|nr:M20/M25/M40 family metallo-hydrolase [Alphaproteobacteria bacterium]MBU1516815.1 M20/M25/M40 family metallo-hydrolase [Alphaproteobacteria bacterium]MBU2092509.1 M20/M25/M40 family metallo-hydrolase [Alphaproteobacteria bacterium]MBU2152360.1 M20/M25/M40 family metallo-hydrolase [Alphaproteobacteria bacterium]MBU2305571.1 M20/M25/M40 family metallo-hydrolase [Alphaproteobacteria bacterium]
MKLIKFVAGASFAVLLAGSATAQSTGDPQASANRVQAHVAFLASDLLQGREAGSPGYDIAANYVASQFAQLGLKPGGADGSYFQPVPLLAVRPADEGRFVLRGKDGAAVPLVFGEEVMPGHPYGPAERKVSAPMVFVGFGVVAPEHRRDDYAGLDVKGKIVVVLQGAPSGLQTEERAYYANGRTKRAQAAAHGAVGMIAVYLPSDEKRRPFASSKRTWQTWAMTWRRPDGTPNDVAADTPQLATVSIAGAAKLFAGAKTTYAKVAEAAAKPKGDPPRFALATTLDATLNTESKTLQSANVAGLIEGSDPTLKSEVVVLSAHLDHIGVTPPVNGDGINNGALDNASGIATTLEVARAFQQSGKAPRRSVLVLAVTGEEKGLLGAEYFARNPTVPLSSLVADVNLDMPILTYDFLDVIAFGAERSSLAGAVRKAAAREGVALSADPMPEEGLFTRSDHFRFVEVGVPSTFLMTGFLNGGEAKFRGFLAGCYHKPCDDLSQGIDWSAGAKFARINYEIAREIADADARPTWNKGDFFATKFARPETIADR